MRHNYILIFILLFFGNYIVSAQGQRKLNKAHKKYDQYMYQEAISSYLSLVSSGYDSPEIHEKLANSYYFNANYTDAVKWYTALYDVKGETTHWESLLRYSQSLKATGEESEAAIIFDVFKNSHDLLDQDLATSEDYLQIISQNASRYQTVEIPINSTNTDFGSFYKEGYLYFSSARESKNSVIDPWSHQPTLDIYKVSYNLENGVYGIPKAFNKDINSIFHESSFVISKDGNTAYFTRSFRTNRKKDPYILKIYSALLVDDEWTQIEELAFNSDLFSNAHPALSADERKLYFVSNRPGTYGQTDIYMCEILADKSLSEPENLGAKINTKGRESFPFISDKNEMYFSSDGHFGMGGYDVYYTDLNEEEPLLLNIGMPINGPKDDFAFSIDVVSGNGFFSSNRNSVDNIFQFKETITIKDFLRQNVKGFVSNEISGNPLEGVLVSVINAKNEIVVSTKTDQYGNYSLSFDHIGGYTVKVEKQGFGYADTFVAGTEIDYNANFGLSNNPGKYNDTQLASLDIGNDIDLDKVFFSHNSSVLSNETKAELLKITKVLKDNPKLSMKIDAHADSRGTDNYNNWLTERRGKRIKDFLALNGVNGNRMSYEGHGENKLAKPCGNLKDCDEEIHHENRRTVFLISDDEDWDEEEDY